MTNEGWVLPGHYTISLGVPIGNDFNDVEFMDTRYGKAKEALCRASTTGMSRNGKHRLLNADFYGRMRYWLFSMLLPTAVNKWITEDASAFLWRSRHPLVPGEKGTKAHLGKYISKKATHRPVKKGGAGVMNWREHQRGFTASWILKLAGPRTARSIPRSLNTGNRNCAHLCSVTFL